MELLQELTIIHLVFDISMVKKCMGDLALIIPIEYIGIKGFLSYDEILVHILDCHVGNLRTKEVTSVKDL